MSRRKRWGVEIAPSEFEFITATQARAGAGPLSFFDEMDNEELTLTVAYAAGQWLTVHVSDEDEWPEVTA